MKIKKEHWLAASKMMIAASKAISPDSLSLDVSPLNKKGKNQEDDIPDNAGTNEGTTDANTRPKIEEIKIAPFIEENV